MAQIQHADPTGMGPPLGLYSQLVHVRNAGLVFVSGQVSIDADGTFVGLGDVARQTSQILHNIGVALEYLSQPWDSLVKLTTYLTSPDDYSAFSEARKLFFHELYPAGRFPTHTLLVVEALSAPHHLVEIDAVIAMSEERS